MLRDLVSAFLTRWIGYPLRMKYLFMSSETLLLYIFFVILQLGCTLGFVFDVLG